MVIASAPSAIPGGEAHDPSAQPYLFASLLDHDATRRALAGVAWDTDPEYGFRRAGGSCPLGLVTPGGGVPTPRGVLRRLDRAGRVPATPPDGLTPAAYRLALLDSIERFATDWDGGALPADRLTAALGW